MGNTRVEVGVRFRNRVLAKVQVRNRVLFRGVKAPLGVFVCKGLFSGQKQLHPKNTAKQQEKRK